MIVLAVTCTYHSLPGPHYTGRQLPGGRAPSGPHVLLPTPTTRQSRCCLPHPFLFCASSSHVSVRLTTFLFSVLPHSTKCSVFYRDTSYLLIAQNEIIPYRGHYLAIRLAWPWSRVPVAFWPKGDAILHTLNHGWLGQRRDMGWGSCSNTEINKIQF